MTSTTHGSLHSPILSNWKISTMVKTSNRFRHFSTWSEEIAYQIIRWATIPDFYTNGNPYKTALAMTKVSSVVRRMAIPAFLHTVVLNNPEQLQRFIDAIHLSRANCRRYPRLALSSDFTRLIRRFWVTDAPHRLVDHDTLDYRTLYDIMQNVDSLGLSFTSLPMLSDCLEEGRNVQREWKCQRLTLAGQGDRWRPLTNTPVGLAFLSKITHLFVHSVTNEDERRGWPYPKSLGNVPLTFMPNLTHFAFPMMGTPDGRAFPIIVYEGAGGQTFRRWATSPDPGNFGTLVPFYAPESCWARNETLDLAAAFGIAEQEQLWPRAVAERENRNKQSRKERR